MSFNVDGNYKGGGFEIAYIQYVVANDLDFGPKDQEDYENDYDGAVPQVTYMPYVFLMQEAYAKRQEEEKEKAKKFSAVFIPIDNIIMEYLNTKVNKFIEGKSDIDKIRENKNFILQNAKFKTFYKQDFFDYINRGVSSEKTSVSVSAPFKGIPIRTGNTDVPFMEKQINFNEEMAMGGGHRRSHKPSQKKTSKGKSRSRSRSRSKTRSKSKSKTRAKSKSKRR